jgi:hypothetical protein
MYKHDCYFDSTRPTNTKYDLRDMRTPISKVGCCGWAAMQYIMFDKTPNTPDALNKIRENLPDPRRFDHKDGMLEGVYKRDFENVFGLNGFVLCEVAQRSKNNDNGLGFLGTYLNVTLKQQLQSGTLKPGTKFLLRVDTEENPHAIAVHVTSEDKILMIDQVTSCFVENMYGNRRFRLWYFCKDFVLMRVLPVSEDPATRARALTRKALETDACVGRLAREYKASLRRLRECRERGYSSAACGAVFMKWRGAYSGYKYSKEMLARAKHKARAEQRLAENAGVVFEPRRRVRRSPRGAAPAGSAALQRLVLDRARTALKLEPLFAAWVRAQAEEAEMCAEPGLRLNKIESIVYGTTYPDKSTADRVESLERQIGLVVLSGPSIPNRLYRIEERLRKKTNPRESAGGVLSVRAHEVSDL